MYLCVSSTGTYMEGVVSLRDNIFCGVRLFRSAHGCVYIYITFTLIISLAQRCVPGVFSKHKKAFSSCREGRVLRRWALNWNRYTIRKVSQGGSLWSRSLFKAVIPFDCWTNSLWCELLGARTLARRWCGGTDC